MGATHIFLATRSYIDDAVGASYRKQGEIPLSGLAWYCLEYICRPSTETNGTEQMAPTNERR